ncbi:MAG: hypothetical protein PVG64_01175 [Syntrophobacterales bacterium]|jgi:hypothetical protein
MSEKKNTILVRANVEITPDSLEAIVANAKKLSRKDTADLVAEMISYFLLENDFEAYVKNSDNYKS